jgi:hypothetical protein
VYGTSTQASTKVKWKSEVVVLKVDCLACRLKLLLRLTSFRTRIYIAKQLLIGVFLGFISFLGAIMKLAANLYVLAQATFGAERIAAKVQFYADVFEGVAILPGQILPFVTTCLLVAGFFLQIIFNILVYVGSYFQFNFTEVESGVDCTGVLSLMCKSRACSQLQKSLPFLLLLMSLALACQTDFPTIIIIVAIVVVLFDSSAFVFLKVSPGDYRHFVPIFMHQFLPKKEMARVFEHFSIQGLRMVMENGFKSVLQVVIANLVFANFIPYWNKISNKCQSSYKDGGAPYSETVAAWLSSILFYVALPFLVHLLLNTVAYGLARPLSRKELQVEEAAAIEAAAKGERAEGRNITRHRATRQTLHTRRKARVGASTNDSSVHEEKNTFVMFNREFTIRKHASLFRLTAAKAGIQDPEAIREVFLHDPRFWQQPRAWWAFFVQHGEGSVRTGLQLYLASMRWKLQCFVKMTLGIWDETLTENMEIKYRSSRFGIANEAGFDTKHESMLTASGEAHSLVWLFFPFCSYISKAGEVRYIEKNETRQIQFTLVLPAHHHQIASTHACIPLWLVGRSVGRWVVGRAGIQQ